MGVLVHIRERTSFARVTAACALSIICEGSRGAKKPPFSAASLVHRVGAADKLSFAVWCKTVCVAKCVAEGGPIRFDGCFSCEALSNTIQRGHAEGLLGRCCLCRWFALTGGKLCARLCCVKIECRDWRATRALRLYMPRGKPALRRKSGQRVFSRAISLNR